MAKLNANKLYNHIVIGPTLVVELVDLANMGTRELKTAHIF